MIPVIQAGAPSSRSLLSDNALVWMVAEARKAGLPVGGRQIQCEVPRDTVFRRTRGGPVSEARAVLCCTEVRLPGMAGTEAGQFLSMGSSAVSRAARRGGVDFTRQSNY